MRTKYNPAIHGPRHADDVSDQQNRNDSADAFGTQDEHMEAVNEEHAGQTQEDAVDEEFDDQPAVAAGGDPENVDDDEGSDV